jgi:hypothetical protein
MQCEWFPELPPAAPDPWRRGKENWLERVMRLFGSAVRWAFNRFVGGRTEAARGKPAGVSRSLWGWRGKKNLCAGL